MTTPAGPQRSVTAETSVPRLRISSPGELVEAVPYLLGVHPSVSVVMVGMVGRAQRVELVIRTDLAVIETPADFAQAALGHLLRSGVDHAFVLVYGTATDVVDGLPEPALVSSLDAALSSAGVRLCDALYVATDRWWSYLCLDPQCCPPEGTARPDPLSAPSAVATTAAYLGWVPFADRAGLERALQIPDPDVTRMRAALEHTEAGVVEAIAAAGGLGGWRALIRRRFRTVIASSGGGGPDGAPNEPWLNDEQVAELLVALVDIRVRDDCWRQLERVSPADQLPFWWWLARRAVPPYDAAPLFLLAWTAWRGGDGVLARSAAERAVASDARYSAAQLLLQALDNGVDPRRLPPLTSGRWATSRQPSRQRDRS